MKLCWVSPPGILVCSAEVWWAISVYVSLRTSSLGGPLGRGTEEKRERRSPAIYIVYLCKVMYSLGTEHNFFVSYLPFTSFCAKEISLKDRTKLRDVWITLFSCKIFENQVSYDDGFRKGDVVHLDEDSLGEQVLFIPERTLDYGRYVIQVEVSWVG